VYLILVWVMMVMVTQINVFKWQNCTHIDHGFDLVLWYCER
jgi:hypothetical protein